MGEKLTSQEKAAYEHLKLRSDARGLPGKSLCYQQLREYWRQGLFTGTPYDDNRVQSSSWEPVLGSEGYWIHMKGTGGFRPRNGQTIQETLDSLPPNEIQHVDITEGRIIQPGETWLFKLKDSITVRQGEYVKASPKSSIGRCFLYVRLLADKHGSFDELHGGEDVLSAKKDVQTQLWVLVQPLTFSHIIRPDIPLLQLRWFQGLDARLTDSEIQELFDVGVPLLLEKGISARPIAMEGLQVHLDLLGEHSGGIVGLRAKKNPNPIDLGEKNVADPTKYFEVIRATNGKYVMKRGEHCLLLTKEQLYTPIFLNMELAAHWGGSFAGPKHFAGFIDNGFARNLVLEVRSDEIDDIELTHGMPIGKLDVYWTDITEKPYGEEIGSHYARQQGPQPSKHFKHVDWTQL